jgi:sulfoacetaldehyde dehydrogenase
MPDSTQTARELVAQLISTARAAQRVAENWSQSEADEAALACGWAIMEPSRNLALAERAVRDTGLGKVEDKIAKNYRKTLGLLRDLKNARTSGVIAEDRRRGIVEIARPLGVVAAITPSTNPAATPANKIINAVKCRNAIILAPSPKGRSTAELLLSFVHDALRRVGAPVDLVQLLPAPITKEATQELMRQADRIVATGSQSNIRMAYASGTPALGVGLGNVAAVVDASADAKAAAALIARSKMFDHATSCSSENSLVILDAIYDTMLRELASVGGVLLDGDEKSRLERRMWRDGHLAGDVIAQSAETIARLAGLDRGAKPTTGFLMVEESGVGRAHPFSGEKLAPVLTLYRVPDFAAAKDQVARIYAYQGAGHSVGLHTRIDLQGVELGLELPVSRVIVNQAHCIATGGSFDNSLPFSLSMGCGSWGRNSFSENLNYLHYMNVTRVVRPIPVEIPSEDSIFGSYFAKHGR